jgi:hypothetical protein
MSGWRPWRKSRSEAQPGEPAIDTEPMKVTLSSWPRDPLRVEHKVTYAERPAPPPPHTLVIWVEVNNQPVTARLSFPLRPGSFPDSFEMSRYWDFQEIKDRHGHQIVLRFEAQWGYR